MTTLRLYEPLYYSDYNTKHYPLYRASDAECTEPDAAPAAIRAQVFRERWDCLSREATYQLLDMLRPRLVLSGHTHHGCKRRLPDIDGLEITVPSFSWRNKDNPNYALAVFTSNNYAVSRCEMPRESTVITLYMFGGFTIALWLMFSLRKLPKRHYHKFKL